MLKIEVDADKNIFELECCGTTAILLSDITMVLRKMYEGCGSQKEMFLETLKQSINEGIIDKPEKEIDEMVEKKKKEFIDKMIKDLLGK